MQTSVKKSVSITLPQETVDFLKQYSQKSLSASISKILKEYQKFSLRQELMEDASSDNDDVMSDFSDYLSLIEKND